MGAIWKQIHALSRWCSRLEKLAADIRDDLARLKARSVGGRS